MILVGVRQEGVSGYRGIDLRPEDSLVLNCEAVLEDALAFDPLGDIGIGRG